MSTDKETTEISQVDVNLDELLGIPGADNIMLPEEKKPTVFSDPKVDTSFIDNPDDEDGEKPISKTEVDNILDEPLLNEDADVAPKATGRPKVDKSGMAELMNKLIEKGQIVPFDDDKSLDEYSIRDFEELLEANFSERESKVRQDTPREFFEALPEELQAAAKYVADGGEDLRGLFRILAEVEEHRQLDPRDKGDQEYIVREYLRATNFGNDSEIEEEIEEWRDRGDLQAKALKFKPKLDKMQEHVVAQKLAQQEHMRKQQQAQAQHYTENIYRALEPGELNGLKLDKKTQNTLFAGLTQANYPSMSGRPTNLLGHLLEKHQYAEPNHGLVAEALWLLSDPDGYRSKVREIGKKEAVEKTVRQLKTEQSNKITSGTGTDDEASSRSKKTGGIQRPTGSFFKR